MTEERVYNPIVVVDETDTVIDAVPLFTALERKYIRRASRVFVFSESGKLLLQQRSKHILKPLLLDQSAAGHVDEGETYQETAERELQEELGLTGELEEVAVSFRTKDFFNGVYRLVVPDDVTIQFDPHEVAAVFWYTPKEVDAKLQAEPEAFTDAFADIWQPLRDTLIP